MHAKTMKPFFWLFSIIMIVSLACGGTTTPPAPTNPPVPTTPPIATEPPAPVATEPPAVSPLLVTSLNDVKQAVIQIEAEGTFIDPEVGWEVNVGKLGSGVIIDPSGIAITNNHVVTGAAILRVWVGGDTGRTYNARVLGVSECSDLAVIDIDGDGFHYLDWYQGEITVGLDVYAAGFPLGDPEFTLTKGIVSKAKASGETSWASVDYVIEHTAKINPGNSGGPLVDANGALVGINYAVVSSTDQNFAISRDEAIATINELRSGKDVESIGVNGGAVYGYIGDTPIYGVWVRSVKSGSPADVAGVEAGDIIYQLENEVLGVDGTMADYCDILRSRNAGDTMNITVIRWSDLALLEGQLNGRSLELTGYFGDGGNGGDGGDGGNGGAYMPENCMASDTYGYISCLDNTYSIIVDVPDYWTDYNGGEWTLDGDIIGVAISAAPSLDDFNDYWDAEGMFFGASDTFAEWGGYIQFLDIYSETYKSGCDYNGRYNYNDSVYRGSYDYFTDCGGRGGYDAYVLSAVPIENQYAAIILMIIQVPAGVTDLVDQAWNTFFIDF